MQKREPTALEQLRRARTLTQAHVAAILGISQQHYSKIERGLEPASAGIKSRLAALLSASVDDIFPPERSKEEAVAS